MKTRTIKRKPTWPKRAKFTARCACGHRMFFTAQPFAHNEDGGHWSASLSGTAILSDIRDGKPYRTDAWKRSLRRIVPAPRTPAKTKGSR